MRKLRETRKIEKGVLEKKSERARGEEAEEVKERRVRRGVVPVGGIER